MEPGSRADPPGTSDAADAVRYVGSAVSELEELQRQLPGLGSMEWRSPAADEFAEVLHQCRNKVAQALQEFEDSAEALRQYEEDLRLWSPGED